MVVLFSCVWQGSLLVLKWLCVYSYSLHQHIICCPMLSYVVIMLSDPVISGSFPTKSTITK